MHFITSKRFCNHIKCYISLLTHSIISIHHASSMFVVFSSTFKKLCRETNLEHAAVIYRHLTVSNANVLANALVSSRLQYCNSLTFGFAISKEFNASFLKHYAHCYSYISIFCSRLKSYLFA